MTTLILGTLLLYLFQTYLPPMIMSRALENMNEAMVVFLPLSLLAVHYGLNDGLAWGGAALFLAARIAYIPVYLTAIGLARSRVWAISGEPG